MATLKTNFNLKHLNTFGLDVRARYIFEPETTGELAAFLKNPEYAKYNRTILGGGSNVLFRKDYDGIIIHPVIRGIKTASESAPEIDIEVFCGEEWDAFVEYCVEHEFSGIENLSWIPGNVGAAPIQNIGAYGVEAKESIIQVEAVDMDSGEKRLFSNPECRFGYRDSIFKNRFKDKYLITRVTFRLKKHFLPNTSYGTVASALEKYERITIKNLRSAIISIRKCKLPDPGIAGNAGSFFKNPVVEKAKKDQLMNQFPGIPSHPVNQERVKIPAAWMIEQCGWKGRQVGNVKVHEHQALVLINTGNATGDEIYQLALEIKSSVRNKFGIQLEEEVNVL